MKYIACCIICISLLSTDQLTDRRYLKAVEYLQSGSATHLLEKVHSLLPPSYQKDTVAFLISDTLINFPPVGSNLVELKYGVAEVNKSVYDSLSWKEYQQISELRKLYRSITIPDLQTLLKPDSANAVVFFSVPYDSIIVAQIFPVNLETHIHFTDDKDNRTDRKTLETVPVVTTFYKQMRFQNDHVQIIFVFDEEQNISRVHYQR